MTIPKAFLALLGQQPMNGNQLRAEFDVRTGSAWPLNVGQAYTTLQRLERDGLVEPVSPEEGSEIFGLTQEGFATVAKWWSEPVKRSRPARDELAIKLTIAVTIPGIDVGGVVRAQRTESMRVMHEYTRLKASGNGSGDVAWRLLLDSMIFHTEAEIRWLDHVEATVLRERTESAPAGSADHTHSIRRAEVTR